MVSQYTNTPSLYEQKRDFTKTPEPKFTKTDKILLSYALPKAKFPEQDEKFILIETEFHPIQYLTFEGEIEKGQYGGGKISIFDYGEFTILDANDKRLIIQFNGKKIKGTYAIIHMQNRHYLLTKVNK